MAKMSGPELSCLTAPSAPNNSISPDGRRYVAYAQAIDVGVTHHNLMCNER